MANKYDEDMEEQLRAAYTACETKEERVETVTLYAEQFGKTRRSIITKLSKMGIYIAPISVSKITGGKPRTKEQLVRELEDKFKRTAGDFETLEKVNKIVLLRLLGDK